MAEWFIFMYGAFTPMTEWEHDAFNNAVADNKNTLEYVWSYVCGGETTNTPYQVDLVRMTQTNTSNGTVRPLLYLADETSQSVTSPFR